MLDSHLLLIKNECLKRKHGDGGWVNSQRRTPSDIKKKRSQQSRHRSVSQQSVLTGWSGLSHQENSHTAVSTVTENFQGVAVTHPVSSGKKTTHTHTRTHTNTHMKKKKTRRQHITPIIQQAVQENELKISAPIRQRGDSSHGVFVHPHTHARTHTHTHTHSPLPLAYNMSSTYLSQFTFTWLIFSPRLSFHLWAVCVEPEEGVGILCYWPNQPYRLLYLITAE